MAGTSVRPEKRMMRNRPSRVDPDDDGRLLGIGVLGRTLWTIVMIVVLLFFILPLFWMIVAATKTNAVLYGSFGLWFHSPFSLIENLKALFSYDGGIFGIWLRNTAIYAAAGGGGAAVFSALAGYAFARFNFRSRRIMFGSIIGSMLIPLTALTIPIYILYSKIGLVNNMFGMIIPSLVSPLGVYLMRVYIDGSVPAELIEAARLDGAGESRILLQIAAPLMLPGFVTVLLLSIVGTWNNYFLPFIIFSHQNLYPLTVGLSNLASQAQGGGGSAQGIEPLIAVGGLVSVLPIAAIFLVLQRYWRSGLLVGSLTG